MVRHDIHITPAPTDWKAALNENMIVLTATKKECMKIVFDKAKATGSVYVFVHKMDGSVQQIRFFK
jgi:myo-inositol-hexaphosphate 3-phosphohydrolase